MQRSSELATGAMLVLTAAMGPLPLSPENLTHSVMAELAEDVKARLESAQDAVEGSQQQAMLRPFSTGTASSTCLLYTSPSPRDRTRSRMPSSA